MTVSSGSLADLSCTDSIKLPARLDRRHMVARSQLTHLFLTPEWADKLHLHLHVVSQVLLESLVGQGNEHMRRPVAL
jgi:hypothetical protein